MLTHTLLLWLHLLAATVWVGGMAAIHFAVRPAAAQMLEPPARLAFMAAMLGRFFVWVSVAIAVLLASGLTLVAQAGGFGGVHWGVHAMFALGLVMMAIFARIRFSPYPQLLRAVAAGDWKSAAGRLSTIRLLVAVNLSIGTLVIGLAAIARAG